MGKYAMITQDVLVYDNSKTQKSLTVVAGEVVKVIQSIGNAAVIRPYNKKSLYGVINGYLNYNIPQTEDAYFVSFGVRKLKRMG